MLKRKHEVLIDLIQNIRAKNNKAWLEYVRLAFKLDPEKAKKIAGKIFDNDEKISKLNKRLAGK